MQRAATSDAQGSTGYLVQLLRRIDEAARAKSGSIDNVNVTHVAVAQDVMVASSDGVLINDKRLRTRVACPVTARRNGQLQTGFCGPGSGKGLELYLDWPPEIVGALAADRALRALEGAETPRGVLPVVLGSSGGGLLLHEAWAHGLEGDALALSWWTCWP